MRISSLFRSATTWALAAIVAVGAYLRLAPLMGRDYWYDEAFTGITIRQPLGEMLNILVHDVHPPLYYLLLKGWALLVGDTPFTIRLFSVLCGLGLIVLFYVALRRFDNRPWVALLGAFAVAINPFFVNYSQEARMYSLLGFLLMLAAFLLVRGWQTGLRKYRVGYGLALLAVLLTHYLGMVFALCMVVADVAHAIRTRQRTWFFASYAITALGFLLWLPFFATQIVSRGSLGWVPDATIARIPTSFHIFLFGAPVGVTGVPPALTYRVDWLSLTLVSALVVIAIIFLVTRITTRKWWNGPLGLAAWLASAPLLLTLALQLAGHQLYVERFLTGGAVFLVLFLVLAPARLNTVPLWAGVTVYTLLVALIAPWQHHASWRAVTDMVAAQPNEPLIVLTGAFDYTVGRFYFDEKQLGRLRLYNAENVNQKYQGWATINEENQIYSLPTAPHIVVTNTPEAFPTYHDIGRVHEYHVMSPL